jgi:hypothetical protein
MNFFIDKALILSGIKGIYGNGQNVRAFDYTFAQPSHLVEINIVA